MAVHLQISKNASQFFANRSIKDADAIASDYDSDLDILLSPFARDKSKIAESKALRRLASKTQVIGMSVNPHVRTRLSHTLEVQGCAEKIASVLGLNVALCSAAALGHDIGHTPFGHAGERFLSNIGGQEFKHNVFSVVIAEQIERSGDGLHLTKQTLQAIKNHSRGSDDVVASGFLEDDVVMLADKIAYTWSDINDIFFRLRLLDIQDYPELEILMLWFGENQRQRMSTCQIGVCNESVEKGKISFVDSEAGKKFNELKRLMYERGIYKTFNLKKFNDYLSLVYEFLTKNPLLGTVSPVVALALMTDLDVFNLWQRRKKLKEKDLLRTSIWEIIPKLQGKKIDLASTSF